MTPTNRAIWGDAYRLMEKYEEPPEGDYDQNKAYWDGLNQGIADFCKAYKNDPMTWKLSVAIFEYISDRFQYNRIGKMAANGELLDDIQHMLFKPGEKQPEQMTLGV